MKRFAFIDAWRKTYPICRMCKVLEVSARGYRAWRTRPMSQRQRDDMVLLAHIREQHTRSLHSYGRPRMTEELRELGFKAGQRRIGRLMRENGIVAIRTRKYKATTDSNHTLESVRRLYVGLQSFRSMSRMDASLMKASALRLRFSQSLASRRQRLSQAMVRSTTQRLGWTTKPFTRSDRLTISVSRSGRMPARAR